MRRPVGSAPLQRLKRRAGVFVRMRRALRWFPPMLSDVVRGRYRPVPWSALGWMLAALVYLLSPLDLVPDMLLALGLMDDAVIVGWLLTRVDRALEDYRTWRERAEPSR
ncbi:YkvA family protein [Halomonas sp. THAF12]|uniref:YkvA family protein n=1 Tax=Halomonas sp. B23F22_10 TaxID=3459515 RepID=UPI00373E05F1